MSQTRTVAKPLKPWLIILIIAGLIFGAWRYAIYEEQSNEQRLMSKLSNTQRFLIAEVLKAGGDISSGIQRYKSDQTKAQLQIVVADLSLKLDMANSELAEKRAENTLFKSEIEDLKYILYTGNAPNIRQFFINTNLLETIRNLETLISQMSSEDGVSDTQTREQKSALAEISILVQSLEKESELTVLPVRRAQN